VFFTRARMLRRRAAWRFATACTARHGSFLPCTSVTERRQRRCAGVCRPKRGHPCRPAQHLLQPTALSLRFSMSACAECRWRSTPALSSGGRLSVTVGPLIQSPRQTISRTTTFVVISGLISMRQNHKQLGKKNMNRNPLAIITLTLLILSLITLNLSVYLNKSLDLSGLLINLFTEILGIIITLIYVDQVIKANEERRWRKTEKFIHNRIGKFALDTSYRISMSLGFKENLSNALTGTIRDMRIDKVVYLIAETIEQNIAPAVARQARTFDDDTWKEAIQQIDQSIFEVNQIFDLFSYRLSAENSQILLEIQNSLNGIGVMYLNAKLVALVSEDELPEFLGDDRRNTASHLGMDVLGNAVSQLLLKCVRLMRTVNYLK
jgi:hypothetical protein